MSAETQWSHRIKPISEAKREHKSRILTYMFEEWVTAEWDASRGIWKADGYLEHPCREAQPRVFRELPPQLSPEEHDRMARGQRAKSEKKDIQKGSRDADPNR